MAGNQNSSDYASGQSNDGGGVAIAAGSGTTNALVKFNASDELEDSGISDNGTVIALSRKGTVTAADAADVVWTVKGAASQTGNLQNWTSSADAVLTSVTKDGYLSIATAANADTLNLFSTGDTNTGFSLPGSDNLVFIVGGVRKVAMAGSETAFNADSNFQYGWASGAPLSSFIDTGVTRASAGVVKVTNGSSGGGALQLQEMTAPPAPPADGGILFLQDNGAGKTQAMILFATGAAQQVAIQP